MISFFDCDSVTNEIMLFPLERSLLYNCVVSFEEQVTRDSPPIVDKIPILNYFNIFPYSFIKLLEPKIVPL